MVAHSIFFYFFSTIAVIAAIMVTVSKNTVHSVFFFILDFISFSCLFIFVVMMLNVAQQKNEWFRATSGFSHIPVGLIVSIIIFFELLIVIGGWKYKPDLVSAVFLEVNSNITNTHAIGNIIYTDYIHLFQASGMILLVAMIGAIVLTFRKREGIKRQSYFKQISRERSESVELVEVESNKGVKIHD